ncbi:peptidoglycan editing factor PgeF [Caenimonas sp. SL110]|uniref:peptidoglycan editing factor PgeF n=1 Tax=Caenimonas sp. SL110 TaxID=1450524 RepID=UPI0006536A83|nr:peptidoglycan editing factor PgeF [Caenimonas sp. SL110]
MVPESWITPAWPAPPGVRALCTTRAGGVSVGAYASLNLGDHVADDEAHVAANRKIFSGALDAHPVFLKQVHGWHVEVLDADTPDGTQADGCVTSGRGIACTIMVADCLPILFATRVGVPVAAVAAAHAGWRGLVGEEGRGIIESTCDALLEVSRGAPQDVVAWLGPCIGPDAFEVGPEVKAAFEETDPGSRVCFKPYGDGKWLADLPALARQRLARNGVHEVFGNDGSLAWCTSSNPSRFFSHRRDRISGRLAASIWLA